MTDLSGKKTLGTGAFNTIKIVLNYYSIVVLDSSSTVEFSQLDNIQRIQRGNQ